MKPLRLTLARDVPARIDVSPLTPDRLQGMKPADIGRMPLQCGRRAVALRDLFELSGTDPSRIEFHRAAGQLNRIGSGMTSGTISVRGDAGDNAGERMAGGEIQVSGSAGSQLGAGMTGGTIVVRGNAGDRIGAPLPGQLAGMRGGLVVVLGDAGDRAADRMRGGVVAVLGGAGALCAHRMLAGTLLVLGRLGAHPGLAMKRGTLVLGKETALPVGFQDAGAMEFTFLPLLFRELAALRPELRALPALGNVARRLAGDQTAGGKGEILVLGPLRRRATSR